jgi:hypothetical protein
MHLFGATDGTAERVGISNRRGNHRQPLPCRDRPDDWPASALGGWVSHHSFSPT